MPLAAVQVHRHRHDVLLDVAARAGFGDGALGGLEADARPGARVYDGVGVHGTDAPGSIGSNAAHRSAPVRGGYDAAYREIEVCHQLALPNAPLLCVPRRARAPTAPRSTYAQATPGT